MKRQIFGAVAVFFATSGVGVSAQVSGGKPVCKGWCGEQLMIEFECTRFELCCGPIVNCATGQTAGVCCPSSPEWCCDADFGLNNVPYADCYPCEPE